MRRYSFLVAAALLAASLPAFATVFATVHGVVHDPQHRPIAGAKIALQAADSDFVLHATTNGDGEFELPQAPIGVYRLTVEASGFNTETPTISLASGTNPVLHIPLSVGGVTQSVVVHGAPSAADTATPTELITRQMIDETPGADRTIGTEMITDYVPGAYMTHDMLHMRGGHQTSWLIDGVAIPNTKIASNVGPQIDPKDIDSLETLSGSYDADLGDRTYGMFNVLPRNGFAFNRDGELMLYAGSLDTGEAQVSLGDHSEKTAWYASATGSRSNYGLATPVTAIYHDATNSESGFVSVIRNQTAKDQLRVDGQLREDYFQVPYDPSQTDYECASTYYCSYGLRDGQTERDSFVIANWVHTFSPKALVSAAPFYHWNQSNYDSNPTDQPVATTWNQNSNYGGAQADARLDAGPEAFLNSFSGGLYSFYQHENDLFGVEVNDGSAPSEPNTAGQRRCGLARVLPWRSSAAGPVCNAAGRRALLHLPRGAQRERDVSAHRDDGADSAAELGAARILRTLLPAGADSDGVERGAGLRRQPGRRRELFFAYPLRARRGAPVRHRDSLPGMDAEYRYVQESRE